MSRAWLSGLDTPLAKAAAAGLQGLGWKTDTGGEKVAADVRVVFLDSVHATYADVGGEGGSVILVAPSAERLDLSGFSLHVQQLAVAAAPSMRVNGIAADEAQADRLAPVIDWLGGADMVTGQLLLLSENPAPFIPF